MSNNGGVYTWSKTAASNAGADNTVNWAEGQAPSSINDSARSMMASAAKYRDDISGALVTGGTSAAYSITSNQNFDTLADFHGQVIAFSPHITNAAGPVTMTVDGFANLPVRTSPGKELSAGTLIQGTPYTCIYNNTDGSLYLRGFYGNPYNIPLGAGLDFWLPTAPNSAFAFPFGQAISRTTYATLFSAMGTTYGTGDGSTTFNLPDKRGRVSASTDDMGGSSAFRLTTAAAGFGSTAHPGAVGGAESETLVTANLPPYTPAGTIGSITSSGQFLQGGNADNFGSIAGTGEFDSLTKANVTAPAPSFTGTAQGGSSVPFRSVQPTIICNYILRII